ncbi:MAG TPA: hypothetical protein VFA90_04005 [Terriglobales bacterium]|nr:hypothetical protein [Terriglobales bacterium]
MKEDEFGRIFDHGCDEECQYASQFGWRFKGNLYGKPYSEFFSSLSDYADWRTGIAALPESQVYSAFLLIAKNQGLDPNKTVQIMSQYYAMVYSVWIPGLADQSLNPASAKADGGWSDPLTNLHAGAGSYYFGFVFDAGHLVDSIVKSDGSEDPINAHIDGAGPLNPFHYLLQLPSMIIPPSPSQQASCSINGGCTF